MNKRYLKIIESVNTFFQNSVLSTIFVFKSNIYQIGSIFEKTLAPILFPLVIIPDAIASLFALYHFARAKNKNLGKTFDLIHAPIKAALVFTAVFAGLSLIFVQGLFLTAIGSSVVYHLGLSIFHAYHWLKSEKNSPIRTLHKNHTLNNLISTSIGGIVVAGIILTMVAAPYLAATILAIAGITAASLLMLTTAFAIYRSFKNSSPSPAVNPTSAEGLEPDLFSIDPSTSDEQVILPSKKQNFNYYYREFPYEKLTGKQTENKKSLLEEIKSKKEILQQQLTNSKDSFFGRLEKSKRQAKISLLNSLTDKIEANDLILPPPQKGAFQSFFKNVGHTQALYEKVEFYFENSAQS